jgi:hypothetical protein
MCRPGVGATNPLFSLWRALWRPTAPARRTKSRRTAEGSRTKFKAEGNNTKCDGKKRFNGSVTQATGFGKSLCYVLPPLILDNVRSLWLSDFIFYPKSLYKLLHQSFFYSFITILPSESGVTLDYCTIFPLYPLISPFHFHFQTFVTWLRENYDYRNVSWEMICIYDLTLSKMRGGRT